MRVEWNEREIDRMLADPVLRAEAEFVAGAVADLARGMAPRGETGRGAAGLRVTEVSLGDSGWQVKVGSDQLTAYMRFPDRGTRYMPAQRFLERAAEQVTGREGNR